MCLGDAVMKVNQRAKAIDKPLLLARRKREETMEWKYVEVLIAFQIGHNRPRRSHSRHSCTSAMGLNRSTLKSVERHEEPMLEKVTEATMMSASPTPSRATARSEDTPLSNTMGRV